METRANYALIGVFTLAVLAAAFMFVFWFSRSTQAGTSPIRIVFTSSVSGLSRGSVVLFNGVRVGEVTEIELAPNDPTRVYASVEVSNRAPVKQDTRARLEYQGLTGVASIALTGGTPETGPLVGKGGEPPLIEAERSDYQNILETLQRLAGRTESVLERADKLLAENTEAVGRTVRNIETFSQALGDSAGGVKSFIAAATEVGDTVKPLVASLDKLSKSVDERVSAIDPERVKSILANADSLAQQLNASAGKFDKLMTSLDGMMGSGDTKSVIAEISEAARSFRKLSDNLDARTKELTAGVARFTSSGLRQYEALAADGRRTLDEVNRTLRSLESNPQQLLFGRRPAAPEYSGR